VSKLFLVYGASGAQGSAVVNALLARGDRVRVISRKAVSNTFAGNPAVELAVGDFADKPSLLQASMGVDGVALTLPLVFDQAAAVQWGKNAIDAAAQVKVPVLAFNTSSVVPQQPTGVTALDIKVALVDYLAKSSIPSVVFKPTIYNGNLAAPWSIPAIVHQGVLAYPIAAGQKVSWISWEDTAAYIVAALNKPDIAASKPIFQIGGLEALTGEELADQLGRVLGQKLAYLAVPLDQFEAGLNANIGEPVGTEISRFYGWMNDAANGSPLNVNLDTVRAVFPVPQTKFTDWAGTVNWRELAGNPR
jgi:NAD(P)H dehydrogenase (quinone)